MNALSLYSGGCDGISLAGSWLGITTLAYCDSEPACRAVLRARHPDAPIFDNDEDVTSDALLKHGIDPAAIDIVFGGPPCQIASCAGQRLGAADPRNRWPEFLRIISDLRPRWILAENVPGLLSAKGKSGIAGELFGDIIAALDQVGYRVGWCCYGAADVGAPHKRERLFIVGYALHAEWRPREPAGHDRDGDHAGRNEAAGWPGASGAYGGELLVADAGGRQLPDCRQHGIEAHHSEASAGPLSGSAGCGGLEHAEGQRHEAHDIVTDRTEPALDPRRSAEGGREGAAQPGLG